MQLKLFPFMMVYCLYNCMASATTITLFRTPTCERCDEIKSFIQDNIFEKQDNFSVNIIDSTRPNGILLFDKFSKFCKFPDNVSAPVVIINEKCYFGDNVNDVFSHKVFENDVQKVQQTTRTTKNAEITKSETAKPKENILYASDLFKEYQANKFAFNQKYDNKLMTISGEISRVDADGNVSLATSNMFYDIKCFVKNKDRVLSLSEKQLITVSGIFKRETSLFDLELYNCVIK